MGTLGTGNRIGLLEVELEKWEQDFRFLLGASRHL